MSRRRPGARHRQVMLLEPTRGKATAGAVVGLVVFGALCAAVLAYRTDRWPEEWRLPEPPPDRAVLIAAAVLGGFAVLCLLSAIVNGRRWRIARRVERWSNDPALVPHLPPPAPALELPPPPSASRPPLTVEFLTPRKLPKPTAKRRLVTPTANVYGAPPLRIAYLRLFENRPRTRTFVEGAWREFGHVCFLRSASSVTPAELRQARRSGDVGGMFVTTTAQLLAHLDRATGPPLGKGRHTFRDVGPTALRVRDPYGSYPMTAVLCHGSFWKQAVDVLLGWVDLVALDLSGFQPVNRATRHELQRVVDRLPVERLVLLVDEQSNRRWLEDQIRDVWARMAPDSPNAIGGPRRIVVGITDHVVRSQSTTTHHGADGHTSTSSGPVQVRLVARRAHTRKLVAMAQARITR